MAAFAARFAAAAFREGPGVACCWRFVKGAPQMFPPSSVTAGGALGGRRTKSQERRRGFTRESGEAVQVSAHQRFVSLLKIHRCLDFRHVLEKVLAGSGSGRLPYPHFLAGLLCAWPGNSFSDCKTTNGDSSAAGWSLESFLFMNKHAA